MAISLRLPDGFSVLLAEHRKAPVGRFSAGVADEKIFLIQSRATRGKRCEAKLSEKKRFLRMRKGRKSAGLGICAVWTM
jgi:hypothetical protein